MLNIASQAWCHIKLHVDANDARHRHWQHTHMETLCLSVTQLWNSFTYGAGKTVGDDAINCPSLAGAQTAPNASTSTGEKARRTWRASHGCSTHSRRQSGTRTGVMSMICVCLRTPCASSLPTFERSGCVYYRRNHKQRHNKRAQHTSHRSSPASQTAFAALWQPRHPSSEPEKD